MNNPTNQHKEIATMLEQAAAMIRGGQPHRAAWRVADAGVLLRDLLESMPESDLCGLDRPTGRGAALPNRAGHEARA